MAAISTYPAGNRPTSIAIADIDSDLIPDLAVIDYFESKISLFIGNGDGSFVPRDPLDASPYVSALAFGDVDLDGRPDLIAAGLMADYYLNSNGGVFKTPRALNWDTFSARSVVVADLDGDGSVDFAGTSDSSDIISVLRNRHGNGFFPKANYPSAHGLAATVAADLDDDGDLDLAATGFSGFISLFINAGDGSFAERTDLTSFPSGVIGAADLDGDGKPELVIPDSSPGGITLLSADPDGAFKPWSNPPAGVYPGNLFIADLDGNGFPDMAIANGESEEITLLWNEGAGAFTVSCLQPGRGATFVAGADLDADSRIDLVITNINRKTMSPIRNLGSRTFLAPSCYIAAKELRSLTPADMDGDGRLDLLVDQTTSMGLYLNDGAGGFIGSKLAVKSYGSIVAEDLNGDGQNDIASGGNSGELYVSLNAGHASFPTAKTYQTLLKSFLRAADMNGDGHPDLIGLSDTPASVCILLNDGQGLFGAPACLPFEINSEEYSATPADLDGDGDLDLVACMSKDSSGTIYKMSVLINDGRGNLSRTVDFPGPVNQALAADWDEDGDIDLASDGLTLYWNDGRANFSKGITLPHQALAFATADVDGDSRLDFVTLGIGVILNRGGRRFAPEAYFPFAYEVAGIGDLNGDGKLDFAAVNQRWRSFLILWNRTSESAVPDRDHDHVPDSCDPDCNLNGLPDGFDISTGVSKDCNLNGIPDECDISSGASVDLRGGADGIPDECEPTLFHRGDGNGDGDLDISDALCMIQYLFLGGGAQGQTTGGGVVMRCLEAADSNNDGVIDCSDAIFVFNYLFLGGEPPVSPGPPPHPCGADTDPRGSTGDLGCDAYARC